MNNTRIRYSKNGDFLKSVRLFTTSEGKQVSVSLSLSSMTFTINDAVSGEVVKSGGRTKNLAVLKIQAKEGLKSLGVNFGEEKRDRSVTDQQS